MASSSNTESTHIDGDLSDVSAVGDSFNQLSLAERLSGELIPESRPQTLTRSKVVKQILKPALDRTSYRRFITGNHESFGPARRFRQRWGIHQTQWDNFVRLLCGCAEYPFILLQNPSNDHDREFEQMIKCTTIQWLSSTLEGIGLSLDEVPVLDICSLFSDNDLNFMGEESKWTAVEAFYDMVERMISILKPQIIICCRCATRGQTYEAIWKWRPARNELARQLCSSTSAAIEGVVLPIDIHGHIMWAVQGVHPCRPEFVPNMESVLEQLFRDMFEPCVEWKSRRVLEESAASVKNIVDASNEFSAAVEGLKSLFLEESFANVQSIVDASSGFITALVALTTSMLDDPQANEMLIMAFFILRLACVEFRAALRPLVES